MPLPDKKSSGKSKNILQTYITPFEQDNDTTTINTVNGEEEPDTGVTYFMDEDGQYYYQPSSVSQNLVSLPAEVSPENKEISKETDMLGADGYQTVLSVPSKSNSGEVNYVVVMQNEAKPVVNMNIMDRDERKFCDVYKFEKKKEMGKAGSDNDNGSTTKAKQTSKRSEYVHPNFTCNFCSYAVHRRYLLLRHMKSHSEERPHKCIVCERGFKTIASLQNHVNMHYRVKPHICTYCNNPFTTSGELVRHVRYRHTYEKPHKCTECDYASVELSKLRRHVRCHTGERPYQCSHCTYAAQDTFKLKRHMRIHTGEKPYKCEHCNMCFNQSNSLKSHKLIHNISKKRVFPCGLCPTKCGRKTDLRIHVQRLHTSDEPLKCKRCGKLFRDRYSFKIHSKTHKGEKCFKCELCLYASTTMPRIESHMFKHLDIKPFVCDQCDQSFRQKQLLRRHQNLYHNPNYKMKPPKEKTHNCHYCKKTFAYKGNLIRHLAIHSSKPGHQESVKELKQGRKRIIKFIEASVKAEEFDPDDNIGKLDLGGKQIECDEQSTVAVGDTQQYSILLEVFQYEDDSEQ